MAHHPTPTPRRARVSHHTPRHQPTPAHHHAPDSHLIRRGRTQPAYRRPRGPGPVSNQHRRHRYRRRGQTFPARHHRMPERRVTQGNRAQPAHRRHTHARRTTPPARRIRRSLTAPRHDRRCRPQPGPTTPPPDRRTRRTAPRTTTAAPPHPTRQPRPVRPTPARRIPPPTISQPIRRPRRRAAGAPTTAASRITFPYNGHRRITREPRRAKPPVTLRCRIRSATVRRQRTMDAVGTVGIRTCRLTIPRGSPVRSTGGPSPGRSRRAGRIALGARNASRRSPPIHARRNTIR